MSPITPRHLFVYGTLQPGQRYWPALEPFTARARPAQVTGWRLWHLEAEGYPAVTPGEGVVRGALIELGEARLSEALAVCDRIEGYVPGDAGSLYERAQVWAEREGARERAWLYHWNPADLARLERRGRVVPGGDWLSFMARRTA